VKLKACFKNWIVGGAAKNFPGQKGSDSTMLGGGRGVDTLSPRIEKGTSPILSLNGRTYPR